MRTPAHYVLDLPARWKAYARVANTGSPTLLIDGVDPFAAPGEPASLSCRLYRLPDGSLDGVPSLDQLRAALDAAAR
jgi:hypothetical protein